MNEGIIIFIVVFLLGQALWVTNVNERIDKMKYNHELQKQDDYKKLREHQMRQEYLKNNPHRKG